MEPPGGGVPLQFDDVHGGGLAEDMWRGGMGSRADIDTAMSLPGSASLCLRVRRLQRLFLLLTRRR